MTEHVAYVLVCAVSAESGDTRHGKAIRRYTSSGISWRSKVELLMFPSEHLVRSGSQDGSAPRRSEGDRLAFICESVTTKSSPLPSAFEPQRVEDNGSTIEHEPRSPRANDMRPAAATLSPDILYLEPRADGRATALLGHSTPTKIVRIKEPRRWQER